MPQVTNNLNLYKTDMENDGNDTFDFDVDLNQNWDKIDERFETFNITLSATWKGSNAPFSQVINITGMKEDFNPVIAPVLSNDYDTAQLQRQEFSKVYRAVTQNGKITFYSKQPTNSALQLQIKV